MVLFGSFFLALLIGVVLIPPLINLSSNLKLVDAPDARHRHEAPVPRVGGIAIVIAAIVPMLIWLQSNTLVIALVAGGGIIALMGLVDDVRDLSHRWKLLGQIVAAVVAIRAGVVIELVPFMGFDPVPAWVAWGVTGFCIVAVSNAINLSDGLDGLAAGLAVMTLAGIGLLAFEVLAVDVLVVTLALLGGLFAFLRHNSHPAVIFMGDAGSQFLGFVLAVVCIELTQQANPALNPALPLWLIGVPLIDMLLVIYWRLRQRQSPFAADTNHLHYRLRYFGFMHYEAVSVIYLAQLLLIGTGVALRYGTDPAVVGSYALAVAAIIALFRIARIARLDLSPYRRDRIPWLSQLAAWRSQAGVRTLLPRALEVSVAAFFLSAGILTPAVGIELTVSAFAVAAALLYSRWAPATLAPTVVRIAIFGAAGITVYGITIVSTDPLLPTWAINGYLVGVTVLLSMSIGAAADERFAASTMDLLVLLLLILVIALPTNQFVSLPIGVALLRLLVLLYAGEFLCVSPARCSRLTAAAFLGTLIVATRGLLAFS